MAPGNVHLVEDAHETCVVFLLGYPGVGKRTVGSHLADLLGGVLVDNQLINIPLLTLFKWDGKFMLIDALTGSPGSKVPTPRGTGGTEITRSSSSRRLLR